MKSLLRKSSKRKKRINFGGLRHPSLTAAGIGITHIQTRGLEAELSSAFCSMNGRNLPLNVMTTRFSPCFPMVVPISQ